MLVYLDSLGLLYIDHLEVEVLEYMQFHRGFQCIQADKYKFLYDFSVYNQHTEHSHMGRHIFRSYMLRWLNSQDLLSIRVFDIFRMDFQYDQVDKYI